MKEEAKYDKMFGYFKYLVTLTIGAITILGTIAGILFVKDHSDMQDRLEKLEKETKQSVGQVQQAATFKIDSLKSNVNRTINTAVNTELDNIFKTQKINNLIEDKVISKVKGDLKEITAIEIKEFNQRIQSDIRVYDEASAIYRKLDETMDPDYVLFTRLLNMYETTTNENHKKIYEEKLEMLFHVNKLDTYSSLKEFKLDYSGYPDNVKEADAIILKNLTGNFYLQNVAVNVKYYNLLHNTNYRPYYFGKIVELLGKKVSY
jgi:hypothetical protein